MSQIITKEPQHFCVVSKHRRVATRHIKKTSHGTLLISPQENLETVEIVFHPQQLVELEIPRVRSKIPPLTLKGPNDIVST